MLAATAKTHSVDATYPNVNVTLRGSRSWWQPGIGPWLQSFTSTVFFFLFTPENWCWQEAAVEPERRGSV